MSGIQENDYTQEAGCLLFAGNNSAEAAGLPQTPDNLCTATQLKFKVDEQLLQHCIVRVLGQDQGALSVLYDQLLGQIYGLALRITRHREMAEEVVQETFWQVWRQAPRYDPQRGSAHAWIMTIARSRALDMLRRVEVNEIAVAPDILNAIEGFNIDLPPDLLAAAQEGQQLYVALMGIDPVQRQLISLAFFRGLSHEEITECTGLPLGTVKSHIRRALVNLKQILKL